MLEPGLAVFTGQKLTRVGFNLGQIRVSSVVPCKQGFGVSLPEIVSCNLVAELESKPTSATMRATNLES